MKKDKKELSLFKEYLININKHIWTLLLFTSCSIALLYGCKAYSFSGTNLKKEVKTFSIENCSSKIAIGPANISELFSQTVINTILQRTQLNHKFAGGDIQFTFSIIGFDFTPIAPKSSDEENIGSTERLTIEVLVSYTNLYDKESSFTDVKFSQFADAKKNADLDAEEPRLVEEIFEKLVSDIMNSSVANW